ncbi:MAG: hypothetical protein ACRCX7_10090 [Cetobacterium sp.]|uniref:hypothetical protein n=1 Tax=Cetobacterium sp. TaxID=2071632 RepID=UPI003F3FA3DE
MTKFAMFCYIKLVLMITSFAMLVISFSYFLISLAGFGIISAICLVLGVVFVGTINSSDMDSVGRTDWNRLVKIFKRRKSDD